MIRRPPRSTRVRSSAASDVYKRQALADSSGVQYHDAAPTVPDKSGQAGSSGAGGVNAGGQSSTDSGSGSSGGSATDGSSSDDDDKTGGAAGKGDGGNGQAVSYTHLTLPTILRVWIS